MKKNESEKWVWMMGKLIFLCDFPGHFCVGKVGFGQIAFADKEEYIDATVNALVECFPDLQRNDLLAYARDKKDSPYIVLEKKLPYEQIQPFVEMQEAVDEDGNKI